MTSHRIFDYDFVVTVMTGLEAIQMRSDGEEWGMDETEVEVEFIG